MKIIVRFDYKLGALPWRAISLPFASFEQALNWHDPFARLTPLTWDELQEFYNVQDPLSEDEIYAQKES
jgi:hypothetical protein